MIIILFTTYMAIFSLWFILLGAPFLHLCYNTTVITEYENNRSDARMSKRITFTIMDYSFLLFFIGLIIISFVLNVYNNLNGYGVDKITPINMVNGFFYKDINEAKICKYFADWKKEAC